MNRSKEEEKKTTITHYSLLSLDIAKYLEGGSPANRSDQRCMESGKVNQTVSSQEEVGNERGNGIQLGDDDATESDDERQNVAAHRFVVLAVATAKRFQVRVQLILGQGLEHFRRRHQTGQGRAQCGCETSGVDQRPERRHQFNHLKRAAFKSIIHIYNNKSSGAAAAAEQTNVHSFLQYNLDMEVVTLSSLNSLTSFNFLHL